MGMIQKIDAKINKMFINFHEFCVGSFSSVSMNFWVFFSIPSKGGRDLAPCCKIKKKNIFVEVENFGQNYIFRNLSEDFL